MEHYTTETPVNSSFEDIGNGSLNSNDSPLVSKEIQRRLTREYGECRRALEHNREWSKNKVSFLERKVVHLEKLIKDWEEEVLEERKKSDFLRQQLRSKAREYDISLSKMRKEMEDLSQNQSEDAVKDKIIQSMKEDIKQLKETHKESEEEFTQMLKRNRDLEREYKLTNHSLSEQKRINMEIMDDFEMLKKDHLMLKNDHEDLSVLHNDLMEKLKSKEEALTLLQERVQNSTPRTPGFFSPIGTPGEVMSEAIGVEAQLQQYEEEITEIKRAFAEEKLSLAAAHDAKCREWSEKLSSSEERCRELSMEYESKKAAMETAMSDLKESFEAQLRATQKQCEASLGEKQVEFDEILKRHVDEEERLCTANHQLQEDNRIAEERHMEDMTNIKQAFAEEKLSLAAAHDAKCREWSEKLSSSEERCRELNMEYESKKAAMETAMSDLKESFEAQLRATQKQCEASLGEKQVEFDEILKRHVDEEERLCTANHQLQEDNRIAEERHMEDMTNIKQAFAEEKLSLAAAHDAKCREWSEKLSSSEERCRELSMEYESKRAAMETAMSDLKESFEAQLRATQKQCEASLGEKQVEFDEILKRHVDEEERLCTANHQLQEDNRIAEERHMEDMTNIKQAFAEEKLSLAAAHDAKCREWSEKLSSSEERCRELSMEYESKKAAMETAMSDLKESFEAQLRATQKQCEASLGEKQVEFDEILKRHVDEEERLCTANHQLQEDNRIAEERHMEDMTNIKQAFAEEKLSLAAAHDAKCREWSEKLSSSEERCRELNMEYESKKAAMETAMSDLKESFEAQLRATQKQCEASLGEKQMEFDEILKRHVDEEERLCTANHQLQEDNRIAEERHLEEMTELTRKLQSETNVLLTQLKEDFEKTICKLNETVAELTREQEDLKIMHKTEMENISEKHKTQVASLEDQLVSITNKYKELEISSKEQIDKQLAREKEQHGYFAKAQESLETEVNKLTETKDRLVKETAILQHGHKKEVRVLIDRLREEEQRHSMLVEKTESRHQEEVKTLMERLQNEIVSFKAKEETLTRTIESLENARNEMAAQHKEDVTRLSEDKEKTCSVLKERLRELEKEKEIISANYEGTIKQLEQKLEEGKENCEKVVKELSIAHSLEKQTLQNEMQMLNGDKEKTVGSLRRELTEVTERCSVLDSTVVQLKTTLQHKEKENATQIEGMMAENSDFRHKMELEVSRLNENLKKEKEQQLKAAEEASQEVKILKELHSQEISTLIQNCEQKVAICEDKRKEALFEREREMCKLSDEHVSVVKEIKNVQQQLEARHAIEVASLKEAAKKDLEIQVGEKEKAKNHYEDGIKAMEAKHDEQVRQFEGEIRSLLDNRESTREKHVKELEIITAEKDKAIQVLMEKSNDIQQKLDKLTLDYRTLETDHEQKMASLGGELSQSLAVIKDKENAIMKMTEERREVEAVLAKAVSSSEENVQNLVLKHAEEIKKLTNKMSEDQQQIAETTNSLQSVNDTLATLQKEHLAARERYGNELKQLKEENNFEIYNMQKIIDELEHNRQSTLQSMKELEARLTSKITDRDNELARVQEQLTHSRMQERDHEEKLNCASLEQEKVRLDCEKLLADLKEEQFQALEALRKENSDLKQQHKDVVGNLTQKLLEAVEEKEREKVVEVEALMQKISDLTSELTEQAKSFDKKITEMKTAEDNRCKGLEKELGLAVSEVEDGRKVMREFRESHQVEMERMQCKVDSCNEVERELRKKLEKYQTELEQKESLMQNAKVELEEEKKRHHNILDTLQQECERQKTDEITKREGVERKYEAEIEALQLGISRLTKENAGLKDDVDQSKSKYQFDVERMQNVQRESIRLLEAKLGLLKEQKIDAVSRLERLQKDLEDTSAKFDLQSQTIKQLEEDKKFLMEDQRRHDESRVENFEFMQKLDERYSEEVVLNKQQSNKIRDLESELSSLHRRLREAEEAAEAERETKKTLSREVQTMKTELFSIRKGNIKQSELLQKKEDRLTESRETNSFNEYHEEKNLHEELGSESPDSAIVSGEDLFNSMDTTSEHIELKSRFKCPSNLHSEDRWPNRENRRRSLLLQEANSTSRSLRYLENRGVDRKRRTSLMAPTFPLTAIHNEEEPEDFDWGLLGRLNAGASTTSKDDKDRLSELQRRNTLCLPHLKSSYPMELTVASPSRKVTESKVKGNATFSSSMTTRKRNSATELGAVMTKRNRDGHDNSFKNSKSDTVLTSKSKTAPYSELSSHKENQPQPVRQNCAFQIDFTTENKSDRSRFPLTRSKASSQLSLDGKEQGESQSVKKTSDFKRKPLVTKNLRSGKVKK